MWQLSLINAIIYTDYLKEIMSMERTFLMIKPDGVQRNLIGQIVERLENKGFKIVGAKLMQVSDDLAKTHYGEHS